MSDNADLSFGVILHTMQGPHVSRETIERVASSTEEFGFDAIWAGDHIVMPEEIPPEYPYSPTGDPGQFFDETQNLYEVFQVLSYVAGLTEDIRLGPHVCIAPLRHPVLLSKIVLTLEALSAERLELGVGVGWLSTEFEILDVPFDERGSRTDEFLAMLEAVCDHGITDFEGPNHVFQTAGFKPISDRGGPPIWIGGHSGAAFRRVAEFGEGWLAVWQRPDAIREARDRIQAAWDDYDRAGSPEISVSRPVHIGTDTDRDVSRPLIGSADTVIDDVTAYQKAGVTRIQIDFFAMDADDQIEQMRRFGEQVLPSF
jgi:probable F420-dependent oxidoreductase